MSEERALQDQYAPHNACFGCGPSNAKGLQLKSFVDGDRVTASFQPAEYHQAFENVLNGGIIGALLDCHSNWTAAYTLMKESDQSTPPCTVTAEFHVKLRAPTPMDEPVELVARSVAVEGSKCTVEAELSSHGKITATCRGVFVAVKEGHPAYHRW